MLPMGLLGIVAVVWSLVDIFRQTAEISIEQFNKPILMGFAAVVSIQTFFGYLTWFQKTRKK